jgi:hypothetical protein
MVNFMSSPEERLAAARAEAAEALEARLAADAQPIEAPQRSQPPVAAANGPKAVVPDSAESPVLASPSGAIPLSEPATEATELQNGAVDDVVAATAAKGHPCVVFEPATAADGPPNGFPAEEEQPQIRGTDEPPNGAPTEEESTPIEPTGEAPTASRISAPRPRDQRARLVEDGDGGHRGQRAVGLSSRAGPRIVDERRCAHPVRSAPPPRLGHRSRYDPFEAVRPKWADAERLPLCAPREEQPRNSNGVKPMITVAAELGSEDLQIISTGRARPAATR